MKAKSECRFWILFSGLVVIAALLRVYLALSSGYLWDEERDWLVTASQISFDSEDPYLPIRARVHGAITAYLAYFGSEIFGETHFGYRFFSIVSGVAFVAFIGLFAKYLFGNLAALFSTLFVALNEFHIVVSATAIQMSHYLLLQCAAIYFLVRAILENRPKFFYLVAAFSALGFLLYELGALMLPFALGAVALSGAWGMLRPKYLAGPILLGLVIASPDIAANLFERDADQLGWGHFAQGLGGLDFTAAFLSFFGREPFDFLFQAVLGRNFHLEGREYAAMNGAFGLAVFLSILAALRVGTSTVEDRKIPIFFVCIILALLVGFSFVGPREGNFYRFFGWMAVALIPSALLVGYASEKRLLGPAVAVCMAIATVMSLSNLVFRNYGMHSYRLVITPRAAYPDPSGCRLFRANFDFCDICEKWTEITDIQVTTRAVQSDSNTSPYCTSSDPGLFLKVPHSDAAAAKDDTGGYNIEIIVQTDKGRKISLTRVIPVSTSDTPKVPTPFWVHE